MATLSVWIEDKQEYSNVLSGFIQAMEDLGLAVGCSNIAPALLAKVLYAELCQARLSAKALIISGNEIILTTCAGLLAVWPLPGQLWLDRYYCNPYHGYVPMLGSPGE